MTSRVDTANRMSKDMTFTDARVTNRHNVFQDMSEHCLNGDHMHAFLQEMRQVALDEFDRDAILVGELPGTNPEKLQQYVLEDRRELSMTFDFDMMVSRSKLQGCRCRNMDLGMTME
jgi:glycosidase